jgi:hypothetical protein
MQQCTLKNLKEKQMAYTIKRVGGIPKALKNIKFKTYDEARRAIRKWINARIAQGKLIKVDATEYINRTINIGNYGFSVAKG